MKLRTEVSISVLDMGLVFVMNLEIKYLADLLLKLVLLDVEFNYSDNELIVYMSKSKLLNIINSLEVLKS